MADNEGVGKTKKAMVVNDFDDFCFTPIGKDQVLVPYKIVAYFDNSVCEHGQVRFKGHPAITMNSRITRVIGNEPGTGGGVKSGVNRGYCRPVTHSSTVRVNKHYVIYHSSKVEMNCNGPDGVGNCIGEVQYLSDQQEQNILSEIEKQKQWIQDQVNILESEPCVKPEESTLEWLAGLGEEYGRKFYEAGGDLLSFAGGVVKYFGSGTADLIASPYHLGAHSWAVYNDREYVKHPVFKYYDDVNQEIGQTTLFWGKYALASAYHSLRVRTGENPFPDSEEELLAQPELIQWYFQVNGEIVKSVYTPFVEAYERNGVPGVIGRLSGEVSILYLEFVSGRILIRLSKAKDLNSVTKLADSSGGTPKSAKSGSGVDLDGKNEVPPDSGIPRKVPDSNDLDNQKGKDHELEGGSLDDKTPPSNLPPAGKTENDGVKITGNSQSNKINWPKAINQQKQQGHILDTPQYKNRVKHGTPTSYFNSAEEAIELVTKAWEKGSPVPGRPNVRDFDFGQPIGTGPSGGPQTKVRVHMDNNGIIHGHPVGPEFLKD